MGVSICPSCITTPAARKEATVIDEIFLLYRDGRLIRHHTRRLKPTVDDKIFSSMLVAVQDFVKDSYGHEEGHLDELKFGDYRIVIVGGRFIIVAAAIPAVAPNNEVEAMKVQIRKATNEIENVYQDTLIDWDGNLDALATINKYIEFMIKGDYA